jgi:hypothetical protein
VTVRSHLILS